MSRLPFAADTLRDLARRHGTPLWVYDAATIRSRIDALRAFDTIRYAQKANANLQVLRLMKAEGVRVDAVSRGEIERALMVGYRGAPADDPRGESELVFTADLIDAATLAAVIGGRIPVNAGSIDMLDQLGPQAPGHPVWLRLNPGFGHGHSRKTNTGGEHSKHGIWWEHLPQALAAIERHRLVLAGLHVHIGSGVDYDHLRQVGDAMVALAAQIPQRLPAISAGGGLSTPYRGGDTAVDVAHYASVWQAARKRIESARGHGVRLEIEPGRYLVAEAGVLLAEVRATKFQGATHFTLIDAGFNELVRPAMYGAWHEMSVIPADASERSEARGARATVVAGPLCESGDVFTQGEGGVVEPRMLPVAQPGDLLVIHDAGAYGASMSSLYNTRPLAAEVLVDGDQTRLIRRRQSIAELLALEA